MTLGCVAQRAKFKSWDFNGHLQNPTAIYMWYFRLYVDGVVQLLNFKKFRVIYTHI